MLAIVKDKDVLQRISNYDLYSLVKIVLPNGDTLLHLLAEKSKHLDVLLYRLKDVSNFIFS